MAVASLILPNSKSLLAALVVVIKDSNTQNQLQPMEPLIMLLLDPAFAQILTLPFLLLQTQLLTLVLNHPHKLYLVLLMAPVLHLPCLELPTMYLNNKHHSKDNQLKTMLLRLSTKMADF